MRFEKLRGGADIRIFGMVVRVFVEDGVVYGWFCVGGG